MTITRPTTAVLVHRFGPYHVARLTAAGRVADVTGVEVSAATKVYAWDAVATPDGFRRVTVCEDDAALTKQELAARLADTLDRVRPQVVFVNGWAGTVPVVALRWCQHAGVPAVVMSESTAHDEARRGWKEAIKRQVVRCFAAGFVGGTLHRDYVVSLSLPADRVFTGYDAVDNAHFAAGADAIRNDPDARRRLGLPERFFLASNRFIPKKNLPALLRGFAEYRRTAGPDAWELVLLGDGPLRGEVERTVADLGLGGAVHLPGFKQYADLPAYYGLAGAFVHASTSEQWGLVVNEAMAAGLPVVVSDRCGCAPDLVADGVNGFTFPPEDPLALADLLRRVATDDALRTAMSTASRERIANWGPEAFAVGLGKAAAAALAAPPVRPVLLSRFILRML